MKYIITDFKKDASEIMNPTVKQGNANGLANAYKKRGKHSPISEEERERILELKAQGHTDRKVAEMVGRAQYSVNRVFRGKKNEPVEEGYFVHDGKMF